MELNSSELRVESLKKYFTNFIRFLRAEKRASKASAAASRVLEDF